MKETGTCFRLHSHWEIRAPSEIFKENSNTLECLLSKRGWGWTDIPDSLRLCVTICVFVDIHIQGINSYFGKLGREHGD